MATPRIYKSQYLTIEATSSGNVTITLGSNLTTADLASFSYSKDKTNWTTWTNDQQGTTITVAMNSGDKLYLKGSGLRLKHAYIESYSIFSFTCNAKVYGNIMSLLYGDNFVNADTVYDHSFRNMFRNATTITVDNLVMPATTLGNYCYAYMFYGCTAITKAPDLPSTTIGVNCYSSMFYGCTSLTTAPTLPATTLKAWCYNSMFNGCTSLNKIKMYATDISASRCLTNWVKNVASTGTFTKAASMESLQTGDSGIPSGWTVKNYNPYGYNGTVFQYGDEIPGYVSYTYTPKIWYDKSKSVNSDTFNGPYGASWDIFSELGISESLILGETEDDLWNYEEILEEICKYFNLHIIQIGYDFYIFDWETSKSGNSVEWVDLLTGNTQQKSYSTITVTKSMYSDDSTQITMGDVYNQIVLEDKVEEYDDIILSPFDDVTDICAQQIYMKEYWATGKGQRARNAFKDLLNGVSTGDTYGDGDGAYTREWWFKVQKPKYWNFSTSTWGDNYARIPVDANDKYYQQWRLAQWVDRCPWASGMFCWGKGDKLNRFNHPDENITAEDQYIVINVQGNGCDSTTGGTIYPNDDDIRTCGLNIEYINNEDGVYSSADPSIHNYIVFSGKMILTTAHERTGGQGFFFDTQNQWNYKVVNDWTEKTQNYEYGYHYVDNEALKRKNNTFENAKTIANGNEPDSMFKYRTVGSDDNDHGRFYTDMFYEQWYPSDEDTRPSETNTYLAPPCAEGNLSKRFKYELDNSKSWYWDGDPSHVADVVPYVDILACTLQIGDKYCCESPDIDEYGRAKKKYEWLTEDEIIASRRYLYLDDGTTMYDNYIYLAVKVNNGQWVIGQSHDIYNNITTDMGLTKTTGQAIPLPYEAHLSGKLKFAIVGVVNQDWKNGLRRHKTWFRHSTTAQIVPIMSHVDKIYIENLDFDFKSDYGKISDKGNDIIYMSDETKQYISKKDDIEFKFNTALTVEEAARMGTLPFNARSTVIDITTGNPVVNIVNNVTSETDKPERFYVDAYYREYNQPRMIVDTSLVDTNQVVNWNKYEFPYIDGKTFFVVKTEKDVKREKVNLTLKERNTNEAQS